MEESLLAVLSVGFVLGIKHAIEPDHMIAVSTIAGHSKNLWRSSLTGVFWGIGHTATLFIVGLLLIMMKGEIPEKWAMSLEFTVGIMLVYLGVTNLFAFGRKKMQWLAHEHDGHEHHHIQPDPSDHQDIHTKTKSSYLKSVLIGFVHGLAGSAAMVLWTMSTVASVWEGGLYILIFGAGTILGMLLFTTLLGIPFVLTANRLQFNRRLTQATGLVSVVFGVYYMYNLGITEGLFSLWMQ
ncbi:LysE family transporter [Brevibacillus dissolubilis]|uniref:LysE family transporter n=1 Tax=Brevibacillus dissolubilis TaxID=1844116 RepID=UPI001115CB05|nr:LysE family transporter [Brevibacillus dissolubilis]